MTPILYKKDETDFTHNGLGLLEATLSCIVTEEMNGQCELKMEYDASGRLFNLIEDDMIIRAKANDQQDIQKFRIYSHEVDQENDRMIIYARHITYDAADNFIERLELNQATTVAAMQAIKSHLAYSSPINFTSDSDTISSTLLEQVNPLEAVAGVDGSILDNWGGEIERDNDTIIMHRRRGRDLVATIRWRKNLTGLNAKWDTSGVVTRIYPSAQVQDEDGGNQVTITLPEKYIDSPEIGKYPHPRIQKIDFFSDDVTDEASLRAKAKAYFSSGSHDKPDISMSVQFQPLAQTEEYQDVAVLERVGLTDTVQIENERLNISATAKVVKIEYNTITEKNENIDLGNIRANLTNGLSSTVAGTVSDIYGDLPDKSFLQDAIDHATDMITGNLGGHVVFRPKDKPQELLIMDTDDVDTAQKVWRWNLSGLGYSSTGVNGPYGLAMTADGAIVADFITAGVLRGILVEGTDIHMFSEDKTFDARLNSNGLLMTKNGQPVFSVDAEGNVKTYGAQIEGGSIHLINDAKDFEAWFDQNGLKLYKNGNPIFTVDADGNLNTYGASIHGGSIEGSSLHINKEDMDIWLDLNGFHYKKSDFDIWMNTDGLSILKAGNPILTIPPDGKAIFHGEVFVKGTETVGETQVESGVRVHPFGVEHYQGDRMLSSLGRIYVTHSGLTPTEYGVSFILQHGDFIGNSYYDEKTDRFPSLQRFFRGWINQYNTLTRNAQIGFIRPLVAKRLMRGSLGTTTANELFPGSSHAPQGLAYAKVNGVEKVYFRIRVSGDAWTTGELNRILEYNLREDGTLGSPVAISNPIAIGHQNISAWVDTDNNQVYLYTGLYNGRGFSKVRWRGAATNSDDVEQFQLWNDGEIYDQYIEGSPCVSKDGQYIVVQAKGTWVGSTRRVQVFNRQFVEANQGANLVAPLTEFDFETTPDDNSQVMQDICCDGNIILILAGYYNPLGKNLVYAFDMAGHRLSEFHVDGPVGEYSDYQMFGWDSSVGIPQQIEPEGIDVRENGHILTLFHDCWRPASTVIAYDGNNYAYINEARDKGNGPWDELYWTRVDRGTNDSNNGGNYSDATEYGPYTDFNKKDKVIYELSVTNGSFPVDRGVTHKRSPASVHVKAGTYDVSFPRGDDFTIASYNQNSNAGQSAGVNAMRTAFKYTNGHMLEVRDSRDGADNSRYSYLSKNSLNGKDQLEIRAGTTLSDGGGINITTVRDSDTVNNSHVILYSRGGSTQYGARLQETGAWRPNADNTQNLGTGSNRWKNIYAANGSINTSDRNMKYDIENLSDEVLDAWSEVNYKQFRFKTSLAEQGAEGARLHVGVIAQDIKEAFERHGLDAMDYGLICFDSWPEKPEIRDENGVVIEPYRAAGAQWGVRPNECLFLESALMRREVNKLKEAVNGGE